MPMSAFSGNVHRGKKSPSFFACRLFSREMLLRPRRRFQYHTLKDIKLGAYNQFATGFK